MSAQNLLFSNLPVSSLGLYNSTSQTIQTINSDSSGNINLNSNVIVGNTLQTTGAGSNASGSITTYNVNAGGSVSAYNINASNDLNVSGSFSCPNFIQTGGTIISNINPNQITFATPFPAGSVPAVSVTNGSGSTWPEIYLSVANVTNTGFDLYQSGTAALEIIAVSYIAVLPG